MDRQCWSDLYAFLVGTYNHFVGERELPPRATEAGVGARTPLPDSNLGPLWRGILYIDLVTVCGAEQTDCAALMAAADFEEGIDRDYKQS